MNRPTGRQGRLRHQSNQAQTVEEIFGWLKTVGGPRKTRHRGVKRGGWMFTLALAAYNLVRLRNVLPAPAWINRQVRVVIPSEAVNTLPDTFRPSLLPAD